VKVSSVVAPTVGVGVNSAMMEWARVPVKPGAVDTVDGVAMPTVRPATGLPVWFWRSGPGQSTWTVALFE
jgi:hypothetical protein